MVWTRFRFGEVKSSEEFSGSVNGKGISWPDELLAIIQDCIYS
jgi:hypothetical protein